MSTAHPADWNELCLNDAYAHDQAPLTDEPPTSPGVALSSPGDTAGPPDSTRLLPGVRGSATFFAPLDPVLGLTPGQEDPRARASHATDSSEANLPPIRACICGATVTPAQPYGNCHGGRACMDRINENEARSAVNADGPHDEPREARMTQEFTEAASWRNAA